MAAKTPKSLIKHIVSSTAPPKPVQQSPRQLMKEFPLNRTCNTEISKDPKNMIREFMSSDVAADCRNMHMTAEDAQFGHDTHNSLLKHPALKDFYPKIVDSVLSLEMNTINITESHTAIRIDDFVNADHDENVVTTTPLALNESSEIHSSHIDRTRPAATPPSVTFSDSNSFDRANSPSSFINHTSFSPTVSQQQQKTNTSIRVQQGRTGNVYTCEFTEKMHSELMSHTAFEHCAPQIIDAVFSLQHPLTRHLWECVTGNGAVRKSSIYDNTFVKMQPVRMETSSDIDVSVTPEEKEVFQRYIHMCIIAECVFTAICVLLLILISVSVIMLSVFILEGYSGVIVSQDMTEHLPLLGLRIGIHWQKTFLDAVSSQIKR